MIRFCLLALFVLAGCRGKDHSPFSSPPAATPDCTDEVAALDRQLQIYKAAPRKGFWWFGKYYVGLECADQTCVEFKP